MSELKQVRRGVQVADALNGALYFRLHYSADEEKHDEWVLREKPKVPDSEWRREMEMDEDVWDGMPVYSGFVPELHAPLKFLADGIPIIPNSLYFGGWDAGTSTIHPAFVLFQVTEQHQIHCLLEVTSGGESMETFAPRVLDAIKKRVPGQWDEVRHFGDHTITARGGATSKTAASVANDKGIRIRPMSNVLQPRISAVEWLLKGRLGQDKDGKTIPRFMVDVSACPLLLEGFRGRYQWQVSSQGDDFGPGAVLRTPLKDMYSHVADACQYAAMAVYKLVEAKGARVQK